LISCWQSTTAISYTHLDPGALGAAFYIPTAVVAPLLVAHIMSFWLLLTKDPSKGVST
jgi:hypothetical protein